MPVPITQEDLRDCVTARDLAELFNVAFGAWMSSGSHPSERRRTPRVALGDREYIYMVSYSHDGQETDRNHPVRIVDLSADGLGVALAEPVPVGASVRFAFASEGVQPDFGVARVARLVKQAEGYLVGVTFAESAHVLDVGGSSGEQEGSSSAARTWRRRFNDVVGSLCDPARPAGTPERPAGSFPGRHRYVIPRDGKLLCIAVTDRRQLLTLRTELELLRCTYDRIVAHPGGPPTPGKPVPSDSDARELQAILHDAAHPLVQKTIAQIDTMCPDLRTEIAMAVVMDEADRIAQEVIGALRGQKIAQSP
jgi:hypothetical protein